MDRRPLAEGGNSGRAFSEGGSSWKPLMTYSNIYKENYHRDLRAILDP